MDHRHTDGSLRRGRFKGFGSPKLGCFRTYGFSGALPVKGSSDCLGFGGLSGVWGLGFGT